MSKNSEPQNPEEEGLEKSSPVRNQLNKEQKDNLFQKEFVPHITSLYNFAYYLCNDEDMSKDLLQETFLKSYRFIEYFEVGTNSKAWLIRILKNSFINEYRKKTQSPRKVALEDVNQKDDIEDDFTVTDLRTEVFENLMGDEVTKAINGLPADYRLIILLCDVENFKYDEIARIIDVPVGTVRSRLHRARNLLKEKLSEYAAQRGFKT